MKIQKLIANRCPLFKYDEEYLKKYSTTEHEKLTIYKEKTTRETIFETDYFSSIDSIYYPGVFEAIKEN